MLVARETPRGLSASGRTPSGPLSSSSVDGLLKSSVELAASKSPGDKLAEALELMDWGIRLKRARLREDHPEAPEDEIHRLLTAWRCRDG